MKIAILSNTLDSFQKPMAAGLKRMFDGIGVEAQILDDGLDALSTCASVGKNGSVRCLEMRSKIWAKRVLRELSYRRLVKRLRRFDVAIVIGHLPVAYYNSFMDDQRLRRDLPTLPIVLYDLIYLGTNDWWTLRLADRRSDLGVPEGDHMGLNRYDYHLCVNEVNGRPLVRGGVKFSRIGLNIDAPGLQIEEPKDFVALIDFERPDQMVERAGQILGCIESGTPFKVLHGRYRMEEICAIYRSCSVYFVAHDESFGLPIAEVQACGARVLTPHAEWCKAHHISTDGRSLGVLPENIVSYDNNKERLVGILREMRASHDAKQNRLRFLRDHSNFFAGNLDELRRFVDRVNSGQINAKSHLDYPDLLEMARRFQNRDWE